MPDPPIVEDRLAPPTLALGAFRLRPMRMDDADAWLDGLRAPGVIEHTSFPPIDAGFVRGMLARVLARHAEGGPYGWALVDPQDRLVGTCGFTHWALDHGHAEIAYDLHPDFQGQGLMSRAVAAVVDWAFTRRGLHRVHAYVMTSNRPSIAVLERAGFEREGTLRAFRIARGTPRDFHLYARLAGGVGH